MPSDATSELLIEPADLSLLIGALGEEQAGGAQAGSHRETIVVLDCRFSLVDPSEGRKLYAQGHIPGAHYLHLSEDLSGPVSPHGGRHPLPDPQQFAARLATLGVDQSTAVVAYDDSRFAFASRLWWLMESLGYRPPKLLNGGYQSYLSAGGDATSEQAETVPCEPPRLGGYRLVCDIEGVRASRDRAVLLVDSRESARYAGAQELIDPIAGHIPGAVNRPWQGVTTDTGLVRSEQELREHWGDALDADELLVYCGSGVTACVNLFSLRLLGRRDAVLYAGSWSDWCSYL